MALGMAMHDKKAAEAMGIDVNDADGLASVNGVGGGTWHGRRESAWLTSEYLLIDAVIMGSDCLSEKKDVARAFGYKEYAEMVIKEAELLKMLVADLPADEYDFRLDVASPGFMLAWAQALERPVPSLVNMDVDDVRSPAQPSLSHPYPRRLAS